MAFAGDMADGVAQPREAAATRRLGGSLVGLAMLGATMLILVLFSGTILQFQILGIDNADGAPPGAARVLMMATYLPIFLMLMTHYRDIPRAALSLRGIVLFLGLLLASILWSINPGASFRATVALTVTTAFAAFIYTHYGLGDAAKIVFAVLLGLIGLSAVLAVVAPGIAIHPPPHAGDWRGYFTHKNVAGQITTWLLPVTLYLGAARRLPLWLCAFAIVATLGFIAMTHSKTALAVAVLLIGLAGVARLLRSDIRATGAVLLAAGGIIALIAVMLMFAPDTLVGLLGRDATFTGRTYIWSELGYLISQQPLLGHGYSAIWDVPYGPLYRFIEDWQIGSGHNSYMDLLVDVGIIGTALFVTLMLNMLRKSIVLIRYGDWPVGLFGFLVFFTLGLISFSETIMPRAHTLHWVIFIVTFMAVDRSYKGLRRPPASQP